jgi:hypothetical protein
MIGLFHNKFGTVGTAFVPSIELKIYFRSNCETDQLLRPPPQKQSALVFPDDFLEIATELDE